MNSVRNVTADYIILVSIKVVQAYGHHIVLLFPVTSAVELSC